MAGERILIVDDNSANVVLLSFLLTTKGYEVRSAADASEMMAILPTFNPRLILMDVQLPGTDGLELTRRLKADPATRSIAVVALTAHAMKGDDKRAHDAGCDGYLSKPIDTRTFPATIATYLATYLTTGLATDLATDLGNAPGADPGNAALAGQASTLPAPPPPAQPEISPVAPPDAAAQPRAVVLVVDDQAPNRVLLRAYLEDRYVVREALDGAAALELLKREPVDLVLLDVMMPHMSGFALCRVIKQRPDGHYLPVILLTALGQQEDRITGLAAGADDFLTKPVNKDELRLRVQTFVRLRQQDARIRRQLADLAERDRLIRGQLEELQALDSLKDELVSLLVHDMRNPLGGITGFLDALENGATHPQAQNLQADARTALEASDRMRETLDDILQVRLLEKGTVRMHRELLEANALVRDAVAAVGGAARARQIELAPDVAASDLPLVADRKLVRRAIESLLTTALKYSAVGGLVSAAARRNGDEIEFEIVDRNTRLAKAAPPVTDELLQRPAAGLGLYLVKLVASAHGGHASVRACAGGGTAFSFSVPRGQESGGHAAGHAGRATAV
jgi:CheY-like chemotaxis protein